jgi:hypothetical protein
VIGASEKPGSVGRTILWNLIRSIGRRVRDSAALRRGVRNSAPPDDPAWTRRAGSGVGR